MEGKLKIKQQDTTYRFYVTDCLKYILDNTANYVGFSGMVDCGAHLKTRYAELINPEPIKKSKYEDDDRPAGEFVADIWKRMQQGGE